MGKKIHVMVGANAWQLDSVKYRRHLLAEFLKKQNDTEQVFWVYPLPATPRKLSTYKQAADILKKGFYNIESKLKLIALPDLIPGRLQRYYRLLQGSYLKKLQEEIEGFAGEKYLWFTTPRFPFLIDFTCWDKVIYDCSDLWLVPPSGKERLLSKVARSGVRKAEKKIIDHSNFIFASSSHLAELIEKHSKKKPVVVENGVDFQLFQKGCFSDVDPLKEIPKPRLGFVGGMKPKIDYPMLSEIAGSKENWSIVLIGPGPEWNNRQFNELIEKQNVYWLGGVSPGEVPGHMKGLDIGLLPYKEIDYNKAVFPLKLFEYLACGIPVVGCGLPSTEAYAEEGIYRHVKAKKFLKACAEVLAWTNDGGTVKKRIQLAENASWDQKFAYMYQLTCGME